MLKTIRGKLILVFTILLLASLVLSQVILTSRVSSDLREQIDHLGKESTTALVDELKNSITVYLPDIVYFSDNADIIEAIKNKEQTINPKLAKEFNHYMEANEGVSKIYVGAPHLKHPLETIDEPYDNTYDARERYWYKESFNETEAKLFAPQIASTKNEIQVTMAKAVRDGNTPIGVVSLNVPLNFMKELILEAELKYQGRGILLSADGTILAHENLEGQNIKDIDYLQPMVDKDEGEFTFKDGNGDTRYVYFDSYNGLKIATSYLESELFASVKQMQIFSVIITLVAVAIGAAIVYMIATRITKPLIQLTNQVQAVSNGDFTVQVAIASKDEIGQLGNYFNTMVDHVRGLLGDIRRSSDKVSDSANTLSAVSEETMATSSQITNAIQDVAQGAVEQASHLDDMQNITQDLTHQFDTVLGMMSDMNEVSSASNAASENGIVTLHALNIASTDTAEQMQTIDGVMTKLVRDITNIQQIIATINGITEQTNLLSLNASIEAARAGEAGKGFAVVASEVRTLAEQSAASATQIEGVILSIVGQAQTAQRDMQKTLQLAMEQNATVAKTEDAFNDIKANGDNLMQALNGLAQQIQEMTLAKDNVVASIENLSAISEQSAAAAQEVSASSTDQLGALSSVAESAEDLNQLSQELESEINRFKTE